MNYWEKTKSQETSSQSALTTEPSPTGYTMKALVNRDVTIPIPPIPIPYSIGGIGIVTSLFTSTFIVYPVGLGIQSDWYPVSSSELELVHA